MPTPQQHFQRKPKDPNENPQSQPFKHATLSLSDPLELNEQMYYEILKMLGIDEMLEIQPYDIP